MSLITAVITGGLTLTFKRTSGLVTKAQSNEQKAAEQHKQNIELHEETERTQLNNIFALNQEITSLNRSKEEKINQIRTLHIRVTQLETILMENKITIPPAKEDEYA